MKPDVAIYGAHVLFYAPFFIRLTGLRKAGEATVSDPRARVWLGFHMLGFGVLYFGIGNAVFGGLRVEMWQRFAGGAVILAGGAIGLWAMRVFRSWRFQAALDAQHELCTDGPFRIWRHPIYVALDLLGIGSAIWLPWWVVIAGAALMLVGADLRARAEERVLLEAFGDRYRQYMARTKRFIPGVY